ncbi:MAG TPA: type II toxin-antitoxin system VapC family toxin [Stellaceae bacterium]|nr:type II toxin-antitoxin system VapC family toxin [Stellaceae bacterium]
MTCIVDASVALKWFLAEEPHSAEALRLVQSREMMIGPDLVIAEVCNAAWRLLRLAQITRAQFDLIPIVLPRYFAELVGAVALAPRAAVIAAALDHPIYDCFYLALAEARHVPLVTADARFLAKLPHSPWAPCAFHLVDYQRN